MGDRGTKAREGAKQLFDPDAGSRTGAGNGRRGGGGRDRDRDRDREDDIAATRTSEAAAAAESRAASESGIAIGIEKGSVLPNEHWRRSANASETATGSGGAVQGK